MMQPGTSRKLPDWVVVANEATAVIYQCPRREDQWDRVMVLQNDAARGREAELSTDREGRSFDSHGRGRHAMTREKSGPKRHAAESFARTVAQRLEKVLHGHQYAAYALIAAPRFLGLLRKELGASSLPEPVLSIDKDVVGQDVALIRKLLG